MAELFARTDMSRISFGFSIFQFDGLFTFEKKNLIQNVTNKSIEMNENAHVYYIQG